MSEEWDKAKKTLNAFISECNCMSSEDYKEAFASVAVGDKLQQENEILKDIALQRRQKLEAMGYHYMAYTCGDIDKLEFANEILELLGE